MKNGQTKSTHPTATKAATFEAKPLLLDIHQLAEALNVGRTTIETWTRNRRIPSLKLGRVRRYDLNQVMSALAAYERKAV
jgi:excisionase family DNA binding protein